MWTIGQLSSLFNLVNEILLPYMVQYSYDQTREVGCCSVTQLCPTLCDPMDCSTPGLPVHHHLLELAQSHVHWVDDAIQPSHPLSSPSPPAFNLSQHLSNESALHIRRPKYCSFSLRSILPMNIQDWFPLGLTGLISLQSKGVSSRVFSNTTRSSKASILWHSAFFIVQFSHSYRTTGKTVALTSQTFVGKVMSLLFNTREVGRVVYNMLQLSRRNTRRVA